MPTIDIVIMTYNREDELKKTLDSLIPYIDDSVTVTVLDNASNYPIYASLAKYENSIKIVKNQVNIGSTLNHITAFIQGSSEYVWVICDDDDYDFKGLNILSQYLKSIKPDVLMVAQSVGNKNFFEHANTIDYYGANLNDVYIKNIDDVAFSFGFGPALLFKRVLLTKAVINEMSSHSDSFYPHVWLQYACRFKKFNIYEKSFIKKPNIIQDVPKILIYQCSWLKMSWDFYSRNDGMTNLQSIIFPSFSRAFLRILDASAINISNFGYKKTVELTCGIIIYSHGKVKLAAWAAFFCVLIFGGKLPSIRKFIWSNKLVRSILQSPLSKVLE